MKAKPFPMAPVATPKGVEEFQMSVGNVRAREYPAAKTSGVKVRGGKAQTKGKLARGPMA